jgi:citrate synthase
MKLVSASEAAKALGISLNTLYAYVSRGMLTSHEGPNRSKRYRWDEIEHLRNRKRSGEEQSRAALDWGSPVIESELTEIGEGQFRYRGFDAIELASSASLEQVASLLWRDDRDYPLAGVASSVGFVDESGFLSDTLTWLAKSQASDPGYYFAGTEVRTEAVCERGWLIVRTLVERLSGRPFVEPTVGEHLKQPPVEQALILCADHELNASAFAARVVASTGADPYAVVSAALMALSGPKHGGVCFQVEALLDEATGKSPREVLEARLRRGDQVPGFGHRLYPQGDPRARFLLKGLSIGLEWAEAGRTLLGLEPSLDLALVCLCRKLGLSDGTAFKIFAAGRSVGWIAHAVEQYHRPGLLRPRAHYVGKASRGLPQSL